MGLKSISVVIALAAVGSVFASSPSRAVNCTHFDQFDWNDMTTQQRNLWGRLGWDANRWDNDKPPATDTKDWALLTDVERNAALALGISPQDWSTDCGTRSGALNQKVLGATNKAAEAERLKDQLDNALDFAGGN
jgi:hypothetical protein